jgi:hypothetical protein
MWAPVGKQRPNARSPVLTRVSGVLRLQPTRKSKRFVRVRSLVGAKTICVLEGAAPVPTALATDLTRFSRPAVSPGARLLPALRSEPLRIHLVSNLQQIAAQNDFAAEA